MPPATPDRQRDDVDVEDYFHVSAFDGVVSRARLGRAREPRRAPTPSGCSTLFDDTSVRATFFVLGWVAERYPGAGARIAARGHEMASHGYAHRLVYDRRRDAFREDVRRAKRRARGSPRRAGRGYRAPSYSITPRSLWALDVLVEEGYAYDASIFPIRHDRYGIPTAPRTSSRDATCAGRDLVEAPGIDRSHRGPCNLPIAGGGYFRLLPYAWTRWGIDRLNRVERQPAVFYLHPWEIDPDQPRLPRPTRWAGSATTATSIEPRHGCGGCSRDFRFAPLRDVLPAQPPPAVLERASAAVA